MTQEMLAARLTVEGKAVSDSTVSNWEAGTTPLPLTAFEPLARALRFDVPSLSRRLGLCTDSPGQTRLAEGADILNQLADEPPEVADTILRWLRESMEIARMSRLARTN